MKKFIKRALVSTIAVAAIAGAYKSYADYQQEKESDMVMQNIEALTGDDVTIHTYVQAKCYMGETSIPLIQVKAYICPKGTEPWDGGDRQDCPKNMSEKANILTTLSYCISEVK